MKKPSTGKAARVIALLAAVALGGCHTTSSLRAGPDGTPLPPRDPEVARDWPPEFRRFVDTALAMFRDGNPEPSIEEFEKRLGIALSDPTRPKEGDHLQRHDVRAPWVRERHPFLVGPPASYLAEMRDKDAGGRHPSSRRYLLRFEMNENPRYCISPYALAIYTGARFTNSDNPVPHQKPRPEWVNAYEWGMFKRGHYGNYDSNMGMGVWVNASRLRSRATDDATCITIFRIGASFRPTRPRLDTAGAPVPRGIDQLAALRP
jgi:hypothetical protein